MTAIDAVDDTTLDQRIVLLGVACHAMDGATPADSSAVRAVCTDRLADPDGPFFGRLSEGDVMSALYALESAGLVEEIESGDPSPVGKGRPEYELTVDPEALLSSLAEDERLVDLVETVRGESA